MRKNCSFNGVSSAIFSLELKVLPKNGESDLIITCAIFSVELILSSSVFKTVSDESNSKTFVVSGSIPVGGSDFSPSLG